MCLDSAPQWAQDCAANFATTRAILDRAIEAITAALPRHHRLSQPMEFHNAAALGQAEEDVGEGRSGSSVPEPKPRQISR